MLLNHLTADLGAAIASDLNALEHAQTTGEVSGQEQPINVAPVSRENTDHRPLQATFREIQ